MLTHGLPGVAFGAEPAAASVMEQPSRSPRESVLGDGLARQIGLIGALIAVVSLGAGLVAQDQGLHLQSVTFVTIGLAQLWVALALRAHTRRTWRQRGLELAVLSAALLQVLAVEVGFLQQLLGTQSLGAVVLLELLLVAALPAALVALVARHARRERR
jgi:Ca2+-transporting ATPase